MFNSFIMKYEECESKGKCRTFNIIIPKPYFIFYSSLDYINTEANEREVFYLMKSRDIVKDKDGKEIVYPATLYTDELKEYPAGDVTYGQDMEFVNTGSKIVLKISNTFDIPLN